MRRFLYVCLGLCLVFTLSFSIFADLPTNDVSGYISRLVVSGEYYRNSQIYPNPSQVDFHEAYSDIPYGQLWQLTYPANSSTYVNEVSISFDSTITINNLCDVYILYDPDLTTNFRDFKDFRVTPDLSVSYSGTINSLLFDFDSITLGDSVNVSNLNLSFAVFNDVYPGNYDWSFSHEFNGTGVSQVYYFAIYVDDTGVLAPEPDPPETEPDPPESIETTGDPNTDYENGAVSYDQAFDMIIDNMNEIVNDENATDFEKQMAVEVAQYQIDSIVQQSNIKYSAVVENYTSESSDLVSSYQELSSSDPSVLLDTVQDLQILYTDSLTQAVSPEQGTFINTSHQLVLTRLKLIYDVNYNQSLEDVVTDEDMQDKTDAYTNLDELMKAEAEAIEIFDSIDYDSKLQFSLWVEQFALDDPTPYKAIFDYLFQDDATFRISPFLIIPFSLVLVGVLLATTTYVFRRR